MNRSWFAVLVLWLAGLACAAWGQAQQRAPIGLLPVADLNGGEPPDATDLTEAISAAAERSDTIAILWLLPTTPQVQRAIEEGKLDANTLAEAQPMALGSFARALSLRGGARVEIANLRSAERYDRCVADVRVYWAAPGQAQPDCFRITKRRNQTPTLGPWLGENASARAQLLQFLAEAVVDTLESRVKVSPAEGPAATEQPQSATETSGEEGASEGFGGEAEAEPVTGLPAGPEEAIQRARGLCGEGNHAEAVKLLQRALDEWPDEGGLFLALGDAYRGMGETDLALRQYERAAAMDLRNTSALLGMAEIYSEKGLWQKAIVAYQQAAQAAPDQAPIRIALAKAYRESGLYKRAIDEYRAALKLDPDNGAIHTGLGDVYRARGDEIAAKNEYIAATKAKRPDAEAWARLGEMHEAAGESEQVLRSYAGRPQMMPSEEEYGRIVSCADETLRDLLEELASILTRFADEKTLVREEAYRAVQAHAQRTDELGTILSGIQAPPDYELTHDSAVYAYRLAVQSDLEVLTWLDTDDPEILAKAMELRQACIDELERLTRQTS